MNRFSSLVGRVWPSSGTWQTLCGTLALVSLVAGGLHTARVAGAAESRAASDAPASVHASESATHAAASRLFSVTRAGERSWEASLWSQTSYRLSRASESELDPDGRPRNEDGFVLDRAQLDTRVTHGAYSLRVAAELTTLGVVGVVPRRAQATWSILQVDASDREDIGLHFSVGLQTVPFGGEVRAGHRERWFADRTLGSSALFPGLSDVGVRLHGGAGVLRADIGLQQGEPVQGRSPWSGRSPTRTAEISGRTGLDVTPFSGASLVLGVSALVGEGFHAGRPAGTDGVTWLDYNENGTLDAGEIAGVPGRAAQRSRTFERWAFGGDLSVEFSSVLGSSWWQAEAVVAQNLDRGYLVSDPIVSGFDLRQLAWFTALHHQTPFGLLAAFRYDVYDPHADFLDDRRGLRLVADASVRTTTILLGWSPDPALRLTGEVGLVRDSLGRDERGEPTDLDNNRVIFRLHVEL